MSTTKESRQRIDLDVDAWQILEIPLGADASWRYEEPSAQVQRAAGELEIRVERFERSHDEVQILDNPKHLLCSVGTFDVPRDGAAVFEYEMAAENFGGDPADYRTGAAAFHLMDFSTAWIFDQLATERRTWALHERLLLPGLVDPAEAFTWVADRTFPPLSGPPSGFLRYSIELDAVRRRAVWTVDDQPYFEVRDLPHVPESVTLGLSVLTLSPLENGRSTSLIHQGMRGRWRNLSYSIR